MRASQSVKTFGFFRNASRPRTADALEERLVAIISEHFDGAWLFARRLGVHEGDLDDVMQEVGAIVAARLDAIGAGSEKSFVFGTVFRVASEARRRRVRRCEVDEELAADTIDGADRPDEVHERREARELLDHLLLAMPLELRAVFVLFEIEERSQVEIAEILRPIASPRTTPSAGESEPQSFWREPRWTSTDFGAHVGNCGITSSIGAHGAFSETNVCARGCFVNGVSRAPSRTRKTSELDLRYAKIGEPHSPQNARSLPGDDSYSRSVSALLMKRNCARSTGVFAPCAVPLAFRQLVQWH